LHVGERVLWVTLLINNILTITPVVLIFDLQEDPCAISIFINQLRSLLPNASPNGPKGLEITQEHTIIAQLEISEEVASIF
jgi:hypothetical protein